jgi:hypothetical protein
VSAWGSERVAEVEEARDGGRVREGNGPDSCCGPHQGPSATQEVSFVGSWLLRADCRRCTLTGLRVRGK